MTRQFCILFILSIASTSIFSQKINGLKTTISKLQGTWVNEKDSLSKISVQNSNWTFIYSGHPQTQVDTYKIDLARELPKYVNPKVKADFIILLNTADTVYFEIFGLTDTILSILQYPTGKRFLYEKKH